VALIVLMGPKHSGKTTTGRELARRLVLPFFDLDQLIEEHSGQSPASLFRSDAELFRREEAAALAALLSSLQKNKSSQTGVAANGRYAGILATGGGIIDNPNAMEKLYMPLDADQKASVHCTVYLDLSAETAWQRISGGAELSGKPAGLPPFLEADTPAEAKEKHRLLHERRSIVYKKIADKIVFAEDKSPLELAEELCRIIT
jgi:shikimate kinase